MKNKSDKHAAAALRILTEIHRELVANRREREKTKRQGKALALAGLKFAQKSGLLSDEMASEIRKAL